jgi:hypothetical protein
MHLGPVRFIVRTAGDAVMVDFTIICFQSRVVRKLIANFHIVQVVTFGCAKKFVAPYKQANKMSLSKAIFITDTSRRKGALLL